MQWELKNLREIEFFIEQRKNLYRFCYTQKKPLNSIEIDVHERLIAHIINQLFVKKLP